MKSSSGFYGLHASAPPGPGRRRLVTLEYQVLTDLAANAGRVLTNEHLVQQVRGAVGDMRPIRTALSKRRRRLGDDLDNPTYFFTEPRVGCRMARGEGQREAAEGMLCVRSEGLHHSVPRVYHLDTTLTQCYRCVMIPAFDESGLLPPGIHLASWDEFFTKFAITGWRRRLAAGIMAAIENLKNAGCLTVYIDGSFVTAKEVPNDFDACWEEAGVDPTVLDPVLLTFDSGRVTQKAKYLGELFPASAIASGEGFSFLEFFQTDKETGGRKGIIAIDLGGLR